MVNLKSKKHLFYIFIFLILTITTVIFSSTEVKVDIESLIIKQADILARSQSVHQNIDMKEITPFHWDRAYIFNTGESKGSIESEIGIRFSNYEDTGVTFIFIKNGEIVYSETYFPIPDDAAKKQLRFNFISKSNRGAFYPGYYYLTPENSVLHLHVTSGVDGGVIYIVAPSNDNQSESSNPYKNKKTNLYP